jgi:ABC-2 type transport system permease protein
MLRNLALYRRLVGILIRSQVHYRIPFFFDLMGTALITTIGFGSLAMIFGRFGSIAGWSLGEVAFLYGIAETSFGLMDMLFSGFDPPNFGRQVRLGLFDQLLLRPVNITLQIMGSDFVLRRIGRILQGMVIFGLAVHMTHVHWTLGKLLYLPLVFASVIAFFGGLFITGATITFWTVESIEIINILTYGGTEMMSYPMHIYQDWLRYFFTYILPAVFLSYYPALYMLDKPDPFHFPAFAPFLSPIVGFGLLALALAFWNFGIRHYQSTGT